MALPTLPVALNGGDVVSNAWVDAVRSNLDFHLNDVPSILISVAMSQATVGLDGITSGTNTVAEFSNGSGTFNSSPVVNNGGWTAGTTGDKGVYVPETGLYRVSVSAQFDAASDTTHRRCRLLDAGTQFLGGIAAGPATSSGSLDTYLGATTLREFTSGDELGVDVYQLTGGTLDVGVVLAAEFVST